MTPQTQSELIPPELSRAYRSFLLPALEQIWAKVGALSAELGQPSMHGEAGANIHVNDAYDHLRLAANALNDAMNFLSRFEVGGGAA